jgi:hypothetical protein
MAPRDWPRDARAACCTLRVRREMRCRKTCGEQVAPQPLAVAGFLERGVPGIQEKSWGKRRFRAGIILGVTLPVRSDQARALSMSDVQSIVTRARILHNSAAERSCFYGDATRQDTSGRENSRGDAEVAEKRRERAEFIVASFICHSRPRLLPGLAIRLRARSITSARAEARTSSSQSSGGLPDSSIFLNAAYASVRPYVRSVSESFTHAKTITRALPRYRKNRRKRPLPNFARSQCLSSPPSGRRREVVRPGPGGGGERGGSIR